MSDSGRGETRSVETETNERDGDMEVREFYLACVRFLRIVVDQFIKFINKYVQSHVRET